MGAIRIMLKIDFGFGFASRRFSTAFWVCVALTALSLIQLVVYFIVKACRACVCPAPDEGLVNGNEATGGPVAIYKKS